MSSFDNKSLKKVTLKSTSTHKCSTSNSVKKNLNIPSIQDDTTSNNFSSTKYEEYEPPIDNKWEDYASKYGE